MNDHCTYYNTNNDTTLFISIVNKNEIYQQNEIAKRQESLQQDAYRQRALQTNRVIDAINKPRTYNFNGNYGNSYWEEVLTQLIVKKGSFKA